MWTTLAAAASLAMIWAVSGVYSVAWTGLSDHSHSELGLWSGRVHLRRTWTPPPWMLSVTHTRAGWSAGRDGKAPRWLWGFEWRWHVPPKSMRSISLTIPLWAPFAPLAALSFFLWRLDRRPAGHCVSCGYDLSGIASRRCPECGVQPARIAS